ncbi:hypothetical protein [Segeticoccus rhizosphaerae]|jgi:hypothetical protein|uniref:hypothetical protein n=1 Tax=Segeticoccus rhizosphaerae TaxID=1104777 RepID=UPI0010BF6D87|nr:MULTISPECIES: hypothetical protein [Intrasporangiaceae]
MNRLRDAIHAKMTADGIPFARGSVRVEDAAFETGIYNTSDESFNDVTFVVEVSYLDPASRQVRRTALRIPAEGWSELWDQARQGIVAAANAAHLEGSARPGGPGGDGDRSPPLAV